MDSSVLLKKVQEIYIPKPDDYSGSELFYSIQEMNHAITALKELAIAQNVIIVDLQSKISMNEKEIGLLKTQFGTK